KAGRRIGAQPGPPCGAGSATPPWRACAAMPWTGYLRTSAPPGNACGPTWTLFWLGLRHPGSWWAAKSTITAEESLREASNGFITSLTRLRQRRVGRHAVDSRVRLGHGVRHAFDAAAEVEVVADDGLVLSGRSLDARHDLDAVDQLPEFIFAREEALIEIDGDLGGVCDPQSFGQARVITEFGGPEDGRLESSPELRARPKGEAGRCGRGDERAL